MNLRSCSSPLIPLALALALGGMIGCEPDGPPVSPTQALTTPTGYTGETNPPETNPPTATFAPTAVPTDSPTSPQTPAPTDAPTAADTHAPTSPQTPAPTDAPTAADTDAPTSPQTPTPTAAPTAADTDAPTSPQTPAPTAAPTAADTDAPTSPQTPAPTADPTAAATDAPTSPQTPAPTADPTAAATDAPTASPSLAPTATPTAEPTPTALTDADGDGSPASEDCDDTDTDVHPGAEERCNDIDDDCDVFIDEAPVDAPTWYLDADVDGYGDDDDAVSQCDPPSDAYTDQGGDCDDLDASLSPGAQEVCDSADNNCNGAIDEGIDDEDTICHARTCLSILEDNPEATSGVYTLDPDGAQGDGGAFDAYCNMEREGGGWMLILSYDHQEDALNGAPNPLATEWNAALPSPLSNYSRAWADLVDDSFFEDGESEVMLHRISTGDTQAFTIREWVGWDVSCNAWDSRCTYDNTMNMYAVVGHPEYSNDYYFHACNGPECHSTNTYEAVGVDCHAAYPSNYSHPNSGETYPGGNAANCPAERSLDLWGFGATSPHQSRLGGWGLQTGLSLGRVAYYVREAQPAQSIDGTSCLDILNQNAEEGAPDGVYRIDPDAGGPLRPLDVYCDMTTAGGGWTLLLSYDHNDDTVPGSPNVLARAWNTANPSPTSDYGRDWDLALPDGFLKDGHSQLLLRRMATGQSQRFDIDRFIGWNTPCTQWDSRCTYDERMSMYATVRHPDYAHSYFWHACDGPDCHGTDTYEAVGVDCHAPYPSNYGHDDVHTEAYGGGNLSTCPEGRDPDLWGFGATSPHQNRRGGWGSGDTNIDVGRVAFFVREGEPSDGPPVVDGASCLDVLERGQSRGDGIYTLDPDGAGGNDPFEAFCDMTTDGGGWTLLLAYDHNDDLMNGAPNPLTTEWRVAHPDPGHAYGRDWAPLLGDDFLAADGAQLMLRRAQTGDAQIFDIRQWVGWDVTCNQWDSRCTYTDAMNMYAVVGHPGISNDYYWHACNGPECHSTGTYEAVGVDCHAPYPSNYAHTNVDREGYPGANQSNCPAERSLDLWGFGATSPQAQRLGGWGIQTNQDLGVVAFLVREGQPSAAAVDGASCQAILEGGGSRGDGLYRLDTDGDGPYPPVDVWCDMSRDDGGWMLLLSYDHHDDLIPGSPNVMRRPWYGQDPAPDMDYGQDWSLYIDDDLLASGASAVRLERLETGETVTFPILEWVGWGTSCQAWDSRCTYDERMSMYAVVENPASPGYDYYLHACDGPDCHGTDTYEAVGVDCHAPYTSNYGHTNSGTSYTGGNTANCPPGLDPDLYGFGATSPQGNRFGGWGFDEVNIDLGRVAFWVRW